MSSLRAKDSVCGVRERRPNALLLASGRKKANTLVCYISVSAFSRIIASRP